MSAFLKSTIGKLCMVAAAALIVIGACLGGHAFWYYVQPKFVDVTVELGTDTVPLRLFLSEHGREEKAAFVTDLSALPLNACGSYPVTLRQGGRMETVTLTGRDTTPPTVTFQDHSAYPGYAPVPEDFIRDATDLSALAYSFAEEVIPATDYSTLTLTVVVTDDAGNTARGDCILRYDWMRDSVTIELGTPLTKADVLLNAEKDGALIDQAEIDAVNEGGVGVYTVSTVSGDQSRECMVTVQDTTPPSLELCDIGFYIGGTCDMDSFIVSCNDLSSVSCTLETPIDLQWVGTQVITIAATDAAGNVTRKQANLYILVDTEPPVIYGAAETWTIKQYTTPDFLDGVWAYDAVDGECAVNLNDSTVDTEVAGTYSILYHTKDTKGNAASFISTVIVKPVVRFSETATYVADVPLIAQFPEYPTGCESVSAVMALRYAGESITVARFINDYLPKSMHFYKEDDKTYGPDPYRVFVGDPRTTASYGCMAPVIEKALVAYFGDSDRVCNTTGSSLDELCHTYIDNGTPVLVWATIRMIAPVPTDSWYFEDGTPYTWLGNEHCMLLVGYDETHYYFHDPYDGELVKFTKALTESRYAAFGNQSLVIL